MNSLWKIDELPSNSIGNNVPNKSIQKGIKNNWVKKTNESIMDSSLTTNSKLMEEAHNK